MSDFLKKALAAAGAVISRQVTIDGEPGEVFFKRMTGAQKAKLVEGLKIHHDGKNHGSIDIDLCQNERQRHLLVLFCVCNQDGSPYFKNEKEVADLDDSTIQVLAAEADSLTREEEGDPGKP